MATERVPIELVGKIRHDSKGWASYVRVDGRLVENWIFNRLREIPEGAIVKVSAEVLVPPE